MKLKISSEICCKSCDATIGVELPVSLTNKGLDPTQKSKEVLMRAMREHGWEWDGLNGAPQRWRDMRVKCPECPHT